MIEFRVVKQAAIGRWANVLIGLGVPAEAFSGKHQPCPACPDTTDTFRWDKTKERYCCGVAGDMYKDGFNLLCRVNGWDNRTALKEVAGLLGITPDQSPEAKQRVKEYAKQAAKVKHEKELLHELIVLELVVGNRVAGRETGGLSYSKPPDETWGRELKAARKIYKLLKLIY